jgi:hypothetical protein
MPDARDPTTSTRARKLISILFGGFFVVVAVLIVATSSPSTRLAALAAAIVVGGLGVDLFISALRGKRSLLSRIGPLP